MIDESLVGFRGSIEGAAGAVLVRKRGIVLDSVVACEIFEVEPEAVSADKDADEGEEGAEGDGDVVDLVHGTDELEGRDAASVPGTTDV